MAAPSSVADDGNGQAVMTSSQAAMAPEDALFADRKGETLAPEAQAARAKVSPVPGEPTEPCALPAQS